ncbi:hypothetical protein DBB_38480 [Desulfoluna spongiiphila]|nr:hypothetical protein DBB_38480 [Desulfoluna spongiiphila]
MRNGNLLSRCFRYSGFATLAAGGSFLLRQIISKNASTRIRICSVSDGE